MATGDSKSITVYARPAHARAIGGVAKISITMPLAWLARGYVLAVRRFSEAAATSPKTTSRDVSIALHEAATWIDSLKGRLPLAQDAHVQGFVCARNRTHHSFAAAVYFDQAFDDWMWQPLEVLPEPSDAAHRNPKLCRCYSAHLERRPVRNVLERIEREVLNLVPDVDLS
jgi:hypothetical protein